MELNQDILQKIKDAAVKLSQPPQDQIQKRVENCELALVELAELLAGGDDSG